MATVNYGNAQRVLQALVQGVDPETGEQLPSDTVLNSANVIRALLTALIALEAVHTRAQRRAQLPASVGKPWDAVEEKRLAKAYQQQEMPIPDIAARHGRTVRAIEARLQKLGVLKPEDRTPGTGFMGEADAPKDGDGSRSE